MGVMGAGGVVLFSPPRIMIINSSSRLLPRCHAPTLAARLGSVTSQTGQLFLGPTPRPRAHSIRRLPVTAFAARLPVSRQTTLKPD